jgi:UDP-GlcNAc:undecaprenyl-phosphate/decaprenyl-phosphate GlcNAc-1-phosphate transferase
MFIYFYEPLNKIIMMLKALILLLSNFIFVCFAIKKIIYISHRKHLFDEPSEIRKIHLLKTPNLGGVAIFISLFLSCCFLITNSSFQHLNDVAGAAIILFGLGLTDDLVGMDPMKKIFTQLFVAFLVAGTTSLRLDQVFHSGFGIPHLGYWPGLILTSLFILFMMNAMNLIDGINGLAGSIGILSSLCYAYIFCILKDVFFFEISVTLCGCLAGFLLFNFSQARVFMGDTGSLFLGFLLSIFSIRLLESDFTAVDSNIFNFNRNSIPLVLSLLIIPISDTVRIFILRLMQNRSPFEADRNHIHHMLLDLGLSHRKATLTLITLNISVCLLMYAMKDQNVIFSIAVLVLYTGILVFILSCARNLHTTRLRMKHYNPDYPGSQPYSFKTGKVILIKEKTLSEKSSG